ncbi:PE-PPE domain-containing protein [Mycolicibacterium litorale]|uniref:PE-PPE domain-containing protein n=1 Tax=Mycolicibacterium litorale TaxID=758802 RepID=A0AAD1IUF3_9MYCO|nr:PE-PPE domain-containing protein [Mycolicibacterium litorale]MCV7418478.1 PE-PPE domain-containing protein [Mycolicibacterium litorale]TDY06125.1 PE-PPE domain-containing protein [Mycolicibacterium litorale]BBY19732.1 PE-PPE domain-containing protein [Mycolicibacterium litorale]
MANHRAEPCRRTADRAAAGRLRRAVLPAAFSSAIVASVVAAGGVAVVHPETVASTMYDLSALITEGSSTNPTGAGIEDFYNGAFADGRDLVTVNFFTGPFGVYGALAAHPDENNVVMSSGWGAANVSLLLTYLHATGGDDPVATDAVYVLDNSVARPNGGFGTRYPVFAVIGVNPLPTPTSPGAHVVDVGYEYDINGNTPAYVLNPFAMANSLATYFDNRLNQNDVNLPVDADGELELTDTECNSVCQDSIDSGEDTTVVLDSGETVVIKQVGQTTYISYRRDGLPLLQPLRTYGGAIGNRFADAVEDPLTDIVNYGYPNNDPLADPDVYRPAGLLPTPRETATFLRNLADPDNNSRPKVTTAVEETDEPAAAVEKDEEITTSPGARHTGPVSTIIRNTIKRLTPAPPKKTAGTRDDASPAEDTAEASEPAAAGADADSD